MFLLNGRSLATDYSEVTARTSPPVLTS
jgi:hypothetical protein